MNNLFILLLLVTLICLPIGLIKPALFSRLLGTKPTRKKAGIVFGGLFILFFSLVGMTDPSQSSTEGNKKVMTIKKDNKPTRIPTPTLTADQFIETHGKAMKKIDDTVINYDLKMATKCAFIIKNVEEGNTSMLSNWSTGYDPIYDLDGEYATESNDVDSASQSANYVQWESLEKIDGQITGDLENVESTCDSLTQDADPVANISSYESQVEADNAEVQGYITQREGILKSLGY